MDARTAEREDIVRMVDPLSLACAAGATVTAESDGSITSLRVTLPKPIEGRYAELERRAVRFAAATTPIPDVEQGPHDPDTRMGRMLNREWAARTWIKAAMKKRNEYGARYARLTSRHG